MTVLIAYALSLLDYLCLIDIKMADGIILTTEPCCFEEQCGTVVKVFDSVAKGPRFNSM